MIKEKKPKKRLTSQTSGSSSRTESCRSTLTVCNDGTTKKSKMILIKLVLKLMKAVHRMTLYWNEYISFVIVSHYCFRQGIYTTQI